MSLPRFFAPAPDERERLAKLSPDETRHLLYVLRLGVGDAVSVFDGRGHEWLGRVAVTSRESATIELGAAVDPIAEPPVQVTLAVGLLKGDQMDSVVRDATMLGVAVIAPMTTAHVSVAGPGRRSDAAGKRWRRVAIASAKQCGRATVPEIAPVARFEETLAKGAAGTTIMCIEPARAAGGPGSLAGAPPGEALLLIGPEGGWAESEIEQAVYAGARLMHLGPRTLRAEAAPTVALSVLWSAWGW
jgi:16S rRNA (uracil1498-N3)-methyltransferase